ncbi:MAG TPA: TIR domain-containing protein [Candidatus Kapabacteria bacterium]|nr:TIR domain-containing protein [Candidatus Kapabacteria bacterium]
MADIFISYSSKDREKAEQLTELLASAGLSVWIDKDGIGAATSWSEEIVNALDECKAFVVMLSPSSIESKNVVRELALAFEKNKKILPLELEPVSLPASMQYHLAGLQRTAMTNIDAIIRALGKLGLEATAALQAPKIVKEADGRKSLMILPFEDLSPTGDNGWFADGIATELISALSNIKALRVSDQQATKDYKRYTGTLPVYAHEMSIRYFVQGSVRKFGDQIKISVSFLDIETGDHLWQDSLRGEMKDIFDIQEAVAKKVTEGLNVILTSDEKQKLSERGTENAEAYELFLKGNEYFDRHTKEGFQLSAQVRSEAIALDPGYAQAYSRKANALAALYRDYDRNPHLLDEGFSLLQEAKRLKPDLASVNNPLSVILMLQGKLEEAERAAQDYVRSAPQDAYSHFSLGFYYMNTNQPAKAIAPFEESLKLKPDDLSALFNLAIVCNDAKEDVKLKQWALVAIPKYEKHLKLFPDDERKRVSHAVLLHFAGRDEDARAAARKLDDLRDGGTLYNTACLHYMLKDYASGLQTFRKAIEAGYRNIRSMKSFLKDEDDGIGSLRGTPEWEAVRQMAEKLEQESAETNNG